MSLDLMASLRELEGSKCFRSSEKTRRSRLVESYAELSIITPATIIKGYALSVAEVRGQCRDLVQNFEVKIWREA